MIYCFDIDGVICTNTWGEYEQAEPIPTLIEQVNRLYDGGERIVLWTARGTTTGIDWRELTEAQLASWGVRYHELEFGKPQADVYIDDRGMSLNEWEVEGRGQVVGAAAVDPENVFSRRHYLDVTYSEQRAPRGEYPSLLAAWLARNVLRSNGRMLDLGCGRGEQLAAFAGLGYDVAGTDLAPQARELAGGLDIRVADLARGPLPFEPASFDFVFSKSVIEHMREPLALLERADEALRPGGLLVVMTPSWEFNYKASFYVDHTHVTPFTRPSLADALTLCGFEEVRVSYFRQLPFLWRLPFLRPVVRLVAALPLPYRPMAPAPWPDGLNKLIRFSKEVMLVGVGRKPSAATEDLSG